MFWDKKEKKSLLPEITPSGVQLETRMPLPPSSQYTPYKPNYEDNSFEDDDFERQSLPSFPDSPMKKGFSQAAIKEAVNTKTSFENTKNPKIMEIEDWSPKSLPPVPSSFGKNSYTQESESISSVSPPSFSEKTKTRSEVFVKIEKFNTAKRSLQAVHEKLDEIDNLLKKIRDTKMREEQELSAWEKDITTLKSRIQEVTENVFEKSE